MKNKTKIFFIMFLIIFGILLSMSTNTFAATTYDDLGGTGYSVTIGSKKSAQQQYFDSSYAYYYIFQDNTNSRFWIFATSYEMCIIPKAEGGMTFKYVPSNCSNADTSLKLGTGSRYYWANISDCSIDTENKQLTFNEYYSYLLGSEGYSNSSIDFDDYTILSCSLDIYEYNTETNMLTNKVFPQPPVEEPPVEEETPVVVEKTLAPIMETTPLEEVMKEILGILPVILMIIVGLISLRKALRLLSRVLHRS